MGLKFLEPVLFIEPVRRLVTVGLKEYACKSHLLYLILDKLHELRAYALSLQVRQYAEFL